MASWSKPIGEEDGLHANFLEDKHTSPDKTCRLCKAITKRHNISMKLWKRIQSKDINVLGKFTPRIYLEMSSPLRAKHLLSFDTAELFSHVDMLCCEKLSTWNWNHVEFKLEDFFLTKAKPQLLRSLKRMRLQDNALYQRMAVGAERGDLVISWSFSAQVPDAFKSKVQYSTTAPGHLQVTSTKENWPDIAKEVMRDRCTGELTLRVLMDESLAFNGVVDAIIDDFRMKAKPSLVRSVNTCGRSSEEIHDRIHAPARGKAQPADSKWWLVAVKNLELLAWICALCLARKMLVLSKMSTQWFKSAHIALLEFLNEQLRAMNEELKTEY